MVARNGFSDVLALLPTIDDVIVEEYNYLNGERTDRTDWLVDLRWFIVRNGSFQDSIFTDRMCELTEENWMEVTKTYTNVIIAFDYVLVDKNRDVGVDFCNGGYYLKQNIEIHFNEEAISRYEKRSDIGSLRAHVDVEDYDGLIKLLPTAKDFDVYKYDPDSNTRTEIVLNEESVHWCISPDSFYSDTRLELTRENWEYAAKHSTDIRIFFDITRYCDNDKNVQVLDSKEYDVVFQNIDLGGLEDDVASVFHNKQALLDELTKNGYSSNAGIYQKASEYTADFFESKSIILILKGMIKFDMRYIDQIENDGSSLIVYFERPLSLMLSKTLSQIEYLIEMDNETLGDVRNIKLIIPWVDYD